MIKLRIYFVKNLSHNSEIKNEIISHLLKKIIKLELNEILYMAEESNVEFKFKIYYDKMDISITGFNDSLKSGLKEFLTNIKNIELNIEKHKEVFLLQKEEYIKKLRNFFLQSSYKVSIDYMRKLLSTGANNHKDLLEFLLNEKLELNDLINFKNKMFLEKNSVWLIQGNLLKETALEIINTTNEILELNIDTPITKSFYSKRAVNLKKKY